MKSRKAIRSKKNRRSKLNRSRIFVDGGLKEAVSELQITIHELKKDISKLQNDIEKKDSEIRHCFLKKNQYTQHFKKLNDEKGELYVSLFRYNQRMNELELKLNKIEKSLKIEK